MTKEEEIKLKEKFSEDDFAFITMLMDHTQRHIDAVRKSLEEAREKDRQRIAEMEKELQLMFKENKEITWAIDIAKMELHPDVFRVLYKVMKPCLDAWKHDLKYAVDELATAKAEFNNSYKSLN